MAPRVLAIAALAAIITTGAAHAQIPNTFAPQQFYTGGIPNAAPPMVQYQPPQYMPPPALPAPMPSPYRVIVPSYGGTSGYGH